MLWLDFRSCRSFSRQSNKDFSNPNLAPEIRALCALTLPYRRVCTSWIAWCTPVPTQSGESVGTHPGRVLLISTAPHTRQSLALSAVAEPVLVWTPTGRVEFEARKRRQVQVHRLGSLRHRWARQRRWGQPIMPGRPGASLSKQGNTGRSADATACLFRGSRAREPNRYPSAPPTRAADRARAPPGCAAGPRQASSIREA